MCHVAHCFLQMHQESTATIQRPPGINSNHPQPTSNIDEKNFPVLKPFKEQLSRRRVNPPSPQTPPPVQPNPTPPPPPLQCVSGEPPPAISPPSVSAPETSSVATPKSCRVSTWPSSEPDVNEKNTRRRKRIELARCFAPLIRALVVMYVINYIRNVVRPHKTWVCHHICQFQHMWPPAGAPGFFFFSLMHLIGPELPISAHVACARVCRQLYVLRTSHALVQATVGSELPCMFLLLHAGVTGRSGRQQECLVSDPC